MNCFVALGLRNPAPGIERWRPTSRLRRPELTVLAVLAVALAQTAFAQEISVENGSRTAVHLKAADIAAMTHQDITLNDHGKTVKFSGVPVKLLLEKAGVMFGESLRGKALANCLLVEAADGYRVVIALPELDPGFTDRVILLADRADGQPLDSKQGPFRVIVPGEKRPARWVRQVTTLKIVEVQ